MPSSVSSRNGWPPPFAVPTDQEHQMTITDDGALSSELIDARIAELGDRRGRDRRPHPLIHQSEPDVVETVKWRRPSNPGGVPMWELDGLDEQAFG